VLEVLLPQMVLSMIIEVQRRLKVLILMLPVHDPRILHLMVEVVPVPDEGRLGRLGALHEWAAHAVDHLLARVHVLPAVVASLLQGVVYRRYHADLQLVVENVESRLQGAPHVLAVISFLLAIVAQVVIELAIRSLDLVEIWIVVHERAVIGVHLWIRCSHMGEVNLEIGFGLRVLDRFAISSW
jgi:hypothetical protein